MVVKEMDDCSAGAGENLKSESGRDEAQDRAELEPLLSGSLMLEEAKQVFLYAWPVVASYFLMMTLPIVCLFFVGQISEAALAGAGLSLMFQNLTGTSILVGLASGLETFASQLYGAGEYRLVGVCLQRSIFILGISTIPTAVSWWFAGEILGACGIGEDMTVIIGPFMKIMILMLPGLALMECFKRYLHAQGIMSPVFHVSIVVNFIHVACLYVLVELDVFGLGVLGAAVTMVISNTASAVILALYAWCLGLHKQTWYGWTWECTRGCWEYLQVALPGLGMLCLEWWSFEIITLFAGRFGTSAVAAQTVLFNTVAIFYMIPLGIGIAATTRVGNALGAGNSIAAKRTGIVSLLFACTSTVLCTVVFALHPREWAGMFSNQEQVVTLVISVLPIQACFFVSDSAAGIFSGIIRGAGRQHVGFGLNLIAFYIVAIPLALLLGFHFNLELPGLWYGLAAGSFTQSGGLGLYVCCVSWAGLASSAAQRVAKQQEQSAETRPDAGGAAERDNQVLLQNAV